MSEFVKKYSFLLVIAFLLLLVLIGGLISPPIQKSPLLPHGTCVGAHDSDTGRAYIICSSK